LSVTRRLDAIEQDPEPPAVGGTDTRVAPQHYVVYRAATRADGTVTKHYEVPGLPEALDEAGFHAWLRAHVADRQEADLVSVLVIREVLDGRGAILTCCLERRRGSASGPFRGNPARVTFCGAGNEVRLYRSTARGALREAAASLEQPPPPPSRLDHLAGEERAIRAVFGAKAQILDVRAPTVLEDMVGLTAIMHLRSSEGTEIDCGLGWHGTTPFVLRADFPRFGSPTDLSGPAAAAVEATAATHRLTTYEARTDADGPAVVARSTRGGAFHLIRPTADSARVEAYTPGVPDGLPNADQALWARYAQSHENLSLIDAYRDGRSDNIFMVAGAANGRVTRHLIDHDGTEVWRAAADDTAVAALHRERVLGQSCGSA
jgi:hypothetical protein